MPRRRPTRLPRPPASALARPALAAGLLLVFGVMGGCGPLRSGPVPRAREIAEAAGPILSLDADAVWTAQYNRLLERGPDGLAWLVEHPVLKRPADPGDLAVFVHLSLARLLIHPAQRPRFSATCLETTLDVLHFEVKVGGERVGTAVWPPGLRPRQWLDLFPADFDRVLAGRIDLEADRRALLAWWREHRGRVVLAPPLKPDRDHLWPLLGRRYADVWLYAPGARTIRCDWRPGTPALFRSRTRDYNLVRAACLWLAADAGARDELIELVASPYEVTAHNARFALRHAPDPRIRELLDRYKEAEPPTRGPATPRRAVARGGGIPRTGSTGNVGQGSAAHEMAQFRRRRRPDRSGGGFYGGQVRQPGGSASPAAS